MVQLESHRLDFVSSGCFDYVRAIVAGNLERAIPRGGQLVYRATVVVTDFDGHAFLSFRVAVKSGVMGRVCLRRSIRPRAHARSVSSRLMSAASRLACWTDSL